MELELVAYLEEMDKRFYGLTFKEVQSLAYEYAECNNIQHPFNKNIKLAGRDWVYGFLARHPNLSLRKPEGISVARAIGFNKGQIDLFFTNLHDINVQHDMQTKPTRTYNMDESGLNTVPNRLPKIISGKGQRSVGKIVSGERGQTVTVVCCMSAAGHFVPPAIIFPRKRMKPELTDGAPSSSLFLLSDSGFINAELFLTWLQHFASHTKPSADDPVLLILDNHSSHISIPAIKFCREHHIHLLSLPPHSSHRLQPLDKTFFGPLKAYYANECSKWMSAHPGRCITQFQIANLFRLAYEKAATIGIATKGFQACGILPMNADIFSEVDFLPSEMTNRPLSSNSDNLSHPVGENMNAQVQQPSTSQHIRPMEFEKTTVTNVPAGHRPMPTENSLENICENFASGSSKSTDISTHACLQNVFTPVKCSVSPQIIRPFPKASHPQKRRRNSKRSEILTSSPYVKMLTSESERNNRPNPKKTTVPTKPVILKTKGAGAKRKLTLGGKKGIASSGKVDYFCGGCGAVYEEPPSVDWIMCCECKSWWEEPCTDYLGNGSFKCNRCK